MLVRCTSCSKGIPFSNKRGNKIANIRCGCGGTVQMLGGNHTLSGQHPFDQTKTHTSQWYVGEYFYAEKTKSGEYYVWHDGYFHKIENPQLAQKPVSQ